MQIRMIHNGRDRDSLLMPLEPRSVDLMLQYSILLERCEPTSHFNVSGTRCTGNGILHDTYGTFHLDPWTDAEWNAFTSDFVGVITRYWDRKFELTPSRPWYQARGAPVAPEAAVITCSLSVGLVQTAAMANQHYYIIKPQETSFRSFAWPEHRKGMFTHRDLTLRWNTRRTRVGHGVRHRVSFLQTVVLHEFGHTLGLGHVNGSSNDDSAYGVTLEQREDLMGMGDHVTAREAQPWIRQMRHHLVPSRGEAALRFTGRVVAPQLITYWDDDWVPPAAPAGGAAAP